MQCFNDLDNQPRVAIDVGADLLVRRAAIAAGEGGQIWLRHDHRNLNRPPSDALNPESDANLFGERRWIVVMEDQRSGGHGSIGLKVGVNSANVALLSKRGREPLRVITARILL